MSGLTISGAAGRVGEDRAAAPVLIPLRARDGSVRAYALVDAQDADRLNEHRWSLDYRGYAIRATTGPDGRQRTVRMHREVLGLVGEPGDVDHLNRVKLDNRRANLRRASRAENLANRGPDEQLPQSGYAGIHFDSLQRRWVAVRSTDGSRRRMGSYATVRDAVAALESAS